MQYSLTQEPLCFHTKGGICITTWTAKFFGAKNPETQFVSSVCLPYPQLDAIAGTEYATEAEARIGHAKLVEKFGSWTPEKVQQEIEVRKAELDPIAKSKAEAFMRHIGL